MKTQISNLINGSEYTKRDLSAEKYINNPIGHFNGLSNMPQYGGTPYDERMAVAVRVGKENPEDLHILANGVELTLARHNSVSGKSWEWEADITAEQYALITGEQAPAWSHKGAVNHYNIAVSMSCEVTVLASSGKKGTCLVLGEEYITIL